MRERIRNILIEALIQESPLFRAVAVKYNGEVYEGSPGMIHADLICDLFGEEAEYEYQRYGMNDVIDGFVTLDGQFVTREQAKMMTGDWESERLRKKGELVEA